MTITVNTAVVANAGADQTSCGASSITLAANATTAETGQVVPVHLLQTEILLMQPIFLLLVKLALLYLLHGMFPIRMVPVLVLPLLIK
jgi:hypothetical protein